MTVNGFADISDRADGSDGSLGGVLIETVGWLEKYITVADPRDLDLLALWAAHTHLVSSFYTTPRLVIDSAMPGSGKTTVIEHLGRLCASTIQAASISSAALLARMIEKEPRTILIDEADRSLDPNKPGIADIVAIINSGYKKGGTRPVLMPGKGGDWEPRFMPTFSPVAMAGNAPHLPDDTRSRALRIVLMPDFEGRAAESDWELIEQDAIKLGTRLGEALRNAADAITNARPELPSGCTGRAKERWAPLARIAYVAGGPWFELVTNLIERNLEEVELERADGLSNLPPAVTLVHHLQDVWPETHDFMQTSHLISLLVARAPEMWGDSSSYGKQLTPQRMGRMLSQAFKVHSAKRFDDVRGYRRESFELVWRRFGMTASNELSRPSSLSVTGGGA